jgi:hypothetical protein
MIAASPLGDGVAAQRPGAAFNSERSDIDRGTPGQRRPARTCRAEIAPMSASRRSRRRRIQRSGPGEEAA